MVLYHIDFTVVAFPFASSLFLELFWTDAIDLIDSTEKRSRKYYIQVLTLGTTHQEGEMDEKPTMELIDPDGVGR